VTEADENMILKSQLKDLKDSFGEGGQKDRDPQSELIDFNREMQWTLIQLKKENDLMKENLQIVMKGGDKSKLVAKSQL
jgi:hypothetical protein